HGLSLLAILCHLFLLRMLSGVTGAILMMLIFLLKFFLKMMSSILILLVVTNTILFTLMIPVTGSGLLILSLILILSRQRFLILKDIPLMILLTLWLPNPMRFLVNISMVKVFTFLFTLKGFFDS